MKVEWKEREEGCPESLGDQAIFIPKTIMQAKGGILKKPALCNLDSICNLSDLVSY